MVGVLLKRSRGRFHRFLPQLDMERRKGYRSPHRTVCFLLDIGHFLHVFSQQRQARIYPRRDCSSLHSRLVRRARVYWYKRCFRCVRRAWFPCGFNAFVCARVLRLQRQSLGHCGRKRRAYRSYALSILPIHSADGHAQNFAIIFPPRDFYGNPSLFYTQSEFSPGDLFTMIPYTAFYFAGVLIGELFYYERMSLLRFTLTKYVFTKMCDALTVGTRSEKKSLRDFSSFTLTTLLGTQKVVSAVATGTQKSYVSQAVTHL